VDEIEQAGRQADRQTDRCLCDIWATEWMTKELWFDSRKRPKICSFLEVFRLILEHNRHHFLFRGAKQLLCETEHTLIAITNGRSPLTAYDTLNLYSLVLTVVIPRIGSVFDFRLFHGFFFGVLPSSPLRPSSTVSARKSDISPVESNNNLCNC
jgi:hypothetical protein